MSVERIRRIEGRALPLPGDNIDTDRIIPARFLRSVSFDGLEQHLFTDDRAQAREAGSPHPLDDPRFEGATILLVGANFGCGSSREHAPQAIRRRGFRALVGVSYSEIFFGNAVALGLPCASVAPEVAASLTALVERDPAAPLALDLERQVVSTPAGDRAIALPAAARDAFLTGAWDATGLLLERYDEVEQVAVRLPYLGGAERQPSG